MDAIRKTADQLVRALEAGEGYTFRTFTMEDVGPYAPDDADWNYKDIPHARFVHATLDAYHSFISEPLIAIFAKVTIGPIKLPLTMVLYSSRPDRQTYHTTYGPFVMIVETTWEAIGADQTRVTTCYYVGGQKVLLNLAFPLIRRVTERNYRLLMVDDLKMRHRRGELRRRGYGFVREGEVTYSYISTLDVNVDHVLPPPPASTAPIRVPLATVPPAGVLQVGDDGAYGVQLRREGDSIAAYPRLCPHEGACLDGPHGADGRVTCPWHGRRFAPVLVRDDADVECGGLSLRIEGRDLVATPRVRERQRT